MLRVLSYTWNTVFHWIIHAVMYEGCLQSSWTHFITLSQNFIEVPPLASDAVLTTLHPLLKNMLLTVDHFEISCLGAHFLWLEKPRNHMGWDLECMADVLMGFHRSTFSNPNAGFNSDFTPYYLWDFPTMKRELWGKKFWSQQSATCFKKWVEHCKKCIACQVRYFKKETVTTPPQSSNSE
jgi:hypothetical protein